MLSGFRNYEFTVSQECGSHGLGSAGSADGMATSVDCDNCKADELKGQVRALNDLIGVAPAPVSSIDLDTSFSEADTR